MEYSTEEDFSAFEWIVRIACTLARAIAGWEGYDAILALNK